jgi:peptidoglycan hydrolase CwlO-like protein
MPILPFVIVVALGCGTAAYANTSTPPTQDDASEVQRLQDHKNTVESEIKSAEAEAGTLKDELAKRKEDIAGASEELKELEARIDAMNKKLAPSQAPAHP